MPGKNKHLTYDERVYIQQNLNKLSFKDIGKKLGKDCTLISREVERHTITVHTGPWGRITTSQKRDCCPSYAQCAADPAVQTTSRRYARFWAGSHMYATAAARDPDASCQSLTTGQSVRIRSPKSNKYSCFYFFLLHLPIQSCIYLFI